MTKRALMGLAVFGSALGLLIGVAAPMQVAAQTPAPKPSLCAIKGDTYSPGAMQIFEGASYQCFAVYDFQMQRAGFAWVKMTPNRAGVLAPSALGQ